MAFKTCGILHPLTGTPCCKLKGHAVDPERGKLHLDKFGRYFTTAEEEARIDARRRSKLNARPWGEMVDVREALR